MLTVEIDPVAVEERLGAGRLACPGCSGVLAGWGSARGRQVRGTDAAMWIVPRRARCTGCRATHVLLPVVLLVRRADTAAVIGAGLTAKATGAGHRLIAALLGRPAETVRGWLRRFAERAEAVRSMFTVWLRAVDPDPVMPEAAGGVFADAVTVMAAVATVIGRRFALPTVSLAETAVAVSGGRLLAPGWPDRRVPHESTLP